MIKLEVNENEVRLQSEGFKIDLGAECILATAALARKFSQIAGVPLTIGTLIMMQKVPKVVEEAETTDE